MGLGDVLRRGMTEQQAGAAVQEVPVRNLMRIVSDGVGELVEANKARSAVGMLKDLIQTAEPDPLSGLKHLKEIGLDFGTLASAQKEAAETYRAMMREERERRQEISQEAEKAREGMYELQLKMLQLQFESFVKSQQQLLEKIEKALGDGKREPDPVTRTVQDASAKIVEEALAKALSRKESDPLEEMARYLSFSDKIAEYFKSRFSGGDGEARRQALVGDIKLETLKLLLEDEREREHLREQRRLEEERTAMIKAAAQALKENAGDFLRALASTAQALRPSPPQSRPNTGQPPARPDERPVERVAPVEI